MKLTEEYVINKATKVLKDINFWDETFVLDKVVGSEGEDLEKYSLDEPMWLVCFRFGEEELEEYGRLDIYVTIVDSTGKVNSYLPQRHGGVNVSYDEATDTYRRIK